MRIVFCVWFGLLIVGFVLGFCLRERAMDYGIAALFIVIGIMALIVGTMLGEVFREL